MGHAKNKPVPEEEPLPPPERPVVVKDEIFTRRKPINDRETLALAIEELAKKVERALADDVNVNGRFARRMRLENFIKSEAGRTSEQFPILMPIVATCWNDVHLLDIELRIIKAIKEKVTDLKHPWYRIRILFDDFIDALTKEILDKLDRDESYVPGDSPPYVPPPAANHIDSPQPSTSKQSASTSSARGTKRAAPKIDFDDDDDVILLD